MSPRVRWSTTVGVVVAGALAVTGFFLVARLHALSLDTDNSGFGDVLGSLGFVVAGAFLARRRPGHPLGWLLLAVGVTEELDNVLNDWAALALHEQWPGLGTGYWVGSWLWVPGGLALGTLVVQLYPDGVVTGWRRWLLRTTWLGIVGATVAVAAAPGAVSDPGFERVSTPLRAPAAGTALLWLFLPVVGACFLVSVADGLLRLWRAPAPQRQQLAWLLLAAVVTVLGKSLLPVDWLASAVLALIPAAVAVGVVRYRLLGIETVVRRTLLYLPLTALVALVFSGLTAALHQLTGDGPLPDLVAASVVVLGIAPARDALQRVVDRFVRGPRIDPMAAVALAAVRGEGDLVVRVLHSVAEALAAPYAAVVQDGVEVASVGVRSGAGVTAGLHYGETYLGDLVVECRQPALLLALAPQVAVVVHAAGLNADLDAARQQAVGAALAERGRLRRDLHDGLGPSLSGVALGLEAAAATLESDPVSTRAVLARARDEVGTAVAEVRRLLDGLHPPELGSYGLAAALRERLLIAGAGPEVVVDAPAALPPMAPAVELAAFRIVSEAVTNARRHACARRCDVRLEVRAGVLRIAVEDDGHGIPADAAAGVGLVSMRHRAEEVGGWLKVDGTPTGTRVEAELPVSA